MKIVRLHKDYQISFYVRAYLKIKERIKTFRELYKIYYFFPFQREAASCDRILCYTDELIYNSLRQNRELSFPVEIHLIRAIYPVKNVPSVP